MYASFFTVSPDDKGIFSCFQPVHQFIESKLDLEQVVIPNIIIGLRWGEMVGVTST